jgi:hypothetical protein
MQAPGFEPNDILLAKTPFRALSPFIERSVLGDRYRRLTRAAIHPPVTSD